MTRRVLIVGATSGIAEAVARRCAERGDVLFLVARNEGKLQVIAADLVTRGAQQAHVFLLDANNVQEIQGMADAVWGALRSVDFALVAHGTLPDQARAETDLNYAVSEFRNNSESVIACLSELATRFAAQGNGTIAVIGSVAGDRGRSSNYLYGAAKAAVDAFASGLRGRLFSKGVHLLTVKPGFVATAMTANLDLPSMLTAAPGKVAEDILGAVERRTNILYTPWFWAPIMLTIRAIPESIFKRLRL